MKNLKKLLLNEIFNSYEDEDDYSISHNNDSFEETLIFYFKEYNIINKSLYETDSDWAKWDGTLVVDEIDLTNYKSFLEKIKEETDIKIKDDEFPLHITPQYGKYVIISNPNKIKLFFNINKKNYLSVHIDEIENLSCSSSIEVFLEDFPKDIDKLKYYIESANKSIINIQCYLNHCNNLKNVLSLMKFSKNNKIEKIDFIRDLEFSALYKNYFKNKINLEELEEILEERLETYFK